MDKEKVVLAMLEKMNNDTRAAGIQSGISLIDVEQQIIQNQSSLTYLLGSLYDFIIEKDLFKE
jgi:hypothetical protein